MSRGNFVIFEPMSMGTRVLLEPDPGGTATCFLGGFTNDSDLDGMSMDNITSIQ